MYDDSEYLVLRINKGHKKGYPFDNFQEAFIKAIPVLHPQWKRVPESIMIFADKDFSAYP